MPLRKRPPAMTTPSAAPLPITGRPSGVAGLKPIHVSAIDAFLAPGAMAAATPMMWPMPSAVTRVSKPTSSIVLPTTSRPSLLGTM